MKFNISNLLIGIVFILSGFLFMGKNLGIQALESITIFYVFNLIWPTLILIFGISFIKTRNFYTKSIGMFITLIALVTLVDNSRLFSFNSEIIWDNLVAILLIYLGLSIVVGKNKKLSEITLGTTTSAQYDDEKKNEYSVAFGSLNLDLSKRRYEKDEFIKIDVAFAGVKLYLPKNVRVKFIGSIAFGGISGLGKNAGGIYSPIEMVFNDSLTPTLTIDLSVAFSGLEVF
jgi:hypothetical protein